MELVPGLKIVKGKNDLDEMELKEQAMLQAEMLKEKAAKDAQDENRKIGLLTQIGMSLSKGYPIELTDEMRDLGLELKYFEMLQKAEYYWKLNQFLFDDEDD